MSDLNAFINALNAESSTGVTLTPLQRETALILERA